MKYRPLGKSSSSRERRLDRLSEIRILHGLQEGDTPSSRDRGAGLAHTKQLGTKRGVRFPGQGGRSFERGEKISGRERLIAFNPECKGRAAHAGDRRVAFHTSRSPASLIDSADLPAARGARRGPYIRRIALGKSHEG